MTDRRRSANEGLGQKVVLAYTMMFVVPVMYMGYIIMLMVQQQQMSEFLHSWLFWTLICGLASGFFMSLAALLLLRRSVKRLRRTEEEVKAVVAQVGGGEPEGSSGDGDEAERISLYVGRLVEALRKQVERVEDYAKQLEDAQRKLSSLTMKDALTGLYNQKYADKVLEAEVARAVEFSRSLGVIVLDLDDFRRFNDEHGRSAGDELLRQVAEIIERNIRPIDTAARIGGETFMVVLPEMGASSAAKVAEKIRLAVESHKYIFAGKGAVSVTLSAGVSGYPSTVGTRESLMSAAMEALKKAKKDGKNRVYPPPPVSLTETIFRRR